MDKEILETIMEMELDKAPSLDGFTSYFYQKCWNTIKEDLWHMLNNSRCKGKIGGATNIYFLALMEEVIMTHNIYGKIKELFPLWETF